MSYVVLKYKEEIITNASETEIIEIYNNLLNTFQEKIKYQFLRLKPISKLEIDSITFYKPFDQDVLVVNKFNIFNIDKSDTSPISNNIHSIDIKLDLYRSISKSNREVTYSIIITNKNSNNLLDTKIILFTSRDVILDLDYYTCGKDRQGYAIIGEIDPLYSFNKDRLYSLIHEKELIALRTSKKEELKKLCNELATFNYTKTSSHNRHYDKDCFVYYLTPFIKFYAEFYKNKILLSLIIASDENSLTFYIYSIDINTDLKASVNYLFNRGLNNLIAQLKKSKVKLSELILKLMAYKKIIETKTK